MKKQILRYGLLAGAIVGLWLYIAFGNIDKTKTDMGFGGGEMLGYSIMLLAFAVCMVLALISFKKENPEAGIGKKILLCLGIAGIASAIYVITWALVYHFIFPDFKEWWLLCMDTQFKKGQIKPDDFKMYKDMMVNYDNPLYFTMYTLIEILPVGVGLSVIVGPLFHFITRKKTA